MNKKTFSDGLVKIQENFSTGYEKGKEPTYNKTTEETLFLFVMKWRESTWNKVIEFLTFSFKPGYNYPLPIPADFKKTFEQIPIDDDYVPIKNQNNGPYATPEEIAAIFEPLVKKIQGGKGFRLRSAHINGIFACEICFRNGCDGVPIERMRNGCAGYLSEEKAQEIEELKKLQGKQP